MKTSKIIGTILVAGMLTGCSATGDKYSVYFDTGSTQLKPSAKEAVVKAARLAKAEQKKVKLSGYTDHTGSKEINKELAEKRIAAVNKVLVKMGVEPMKISSTARGEGWFDKKDETNNKKRRVEISVY